MYLDAQKRGPNAFKGLVKSLVESGNFEAANILDPSVEVPKQLPRAVMASPSSRVQ